MNRYVCIHGHFYQPPRENPWLEYVELQDSAYPYHDWNERITAECYAPNGRSRILNPEGKIAELVNNYSWMSFNVGPTLLAWLAEQAPDVYQIDPGRRPGEPAALFGTRIGSGASLQSHDSPAGQSAGHRDADRLGY